MKHAYDVYGVKLQNNISGEPSFVMRVEARNKADAVYRAAEEHIQAYTLHSHLECYRHAGRVLTVEALEDLSERSFSREEALMAEAIHE